MRKTMTLSLLALLAAVFAWQPAPVSAQAGILCSQAAGFNVGSFQYNTCVDYANSVAQLSTDNARVEEIRAVFAPIRADYNRLGPFPFSSDDLFEQQERREWIQSAGDQIEASAPLLDELEEIIQRRQNFLTEAAQYQSILSLLAGDSRAIDAARALNARLVNLPAERQRLENWRSLLNDSRTLTTQVYAAEVLTPEDAERRAEEAEEQDEPESPNTQDIDPLTDFDDDLIPDDLDDCRFEAGPPENNGCPLEDDDDCRFEPGPAENNGCPVEDEPSIDDEDLGDDLDDIDLDDLDLDEDSLSDDQDLQDALDDIDEAMEDLGESLDTDEPADEEPASDPELQEAIDEMDEAMSDLIESAIDQCPDLPGPAINNGCPLGDEGQDPAGDGDGDGVFNAVDICVDEPGVASNNGCPVTVTDYDDDGVPNVLDDCPLLIGTASEAGCPSEEPVVVEDDDLPFDINESAGSIPEPDTGDLDFGQLPPCDPDSTGADTALPCEVVPNNNGPRRACDGSTGTVPDECFEDSAATQTFSGTFTLFQSDAGGCGFSAAPNTGGSITITVDYATRTATANIEGGGSGIRANLYCDGGYGDMTWNAGYSATLGGTVQPIGESSQYVFFEGDVSGSGSFSWSNCRLENGDGLECPAGGGGGFTLPIVIDGELTANDTGFGTVRVDAGGLFTEGSWTIP